MNDEVVSFFEQLVESVWRCQLRHIAKFELVLPLGVGPQKLLGLFLGAKRCRYIVA